MNMGGGRDCRAGETQGLLEGGPKVRGYSSMLERAGHAIQRLQPLCCTAVCVCSSQLSEEAPSAHPPRGEDLGTGSHDREPWTCKSRCVPGLWCETLFSATVRDEGGMGRDREREGGCPRKDAAVSSEEMNEGLPWWLSGKDHQCRRHGVDP